MCFVDGVCGPCQNNTDALKICRADKRDALNRPNKLNVSLRTATVFQCVWMFRTELKGKYCFLRCKNWLMIKDRLSLYMWFGFWRMQDSSKNGSFVHPVPCFHHVVIYVFDVEDG